LKIKKVQTKLKAFLKFKNGGFFDLEKSFSFLSKNFSLALAPPKKQKGPKELRDLNKVQVRVRPELR